MKFYSLAWSYIDVPMSAVRLGTVVQLTEPPKQLGDPRTIVDKYGHIVGFSRNLLNELILRVLWDDETSTCINSTHLILLTD